MSESTATEQAAASDRRGYLIEVVTAILLGLATLGAAYAAYQASLYDGNSLDRYSEAIAKTAETSGKQLEAQGGFTLDMITWMEWQSRVIASGSENSAQAKADEVIAQSIYDDFMEERLKDALDWSDKESKAQKKFVHPTESPDYGLALFSDAFENQEQATNAMKAARKANDIGDRFTLLTVLYTIALFFAGIATVFKRDPVKLALLGMGVALFLFTTAKLAMLPAAG